MILSEFLNVYLTNGNTLWEGKGEKNLNAYMGMFNGLTNFPTVTAMPKPEEAEPEEEDPTADPTQDAKKPPEKAKTPGAFLGDDGAKATNFANGNYAYRGTGANAPGFSFAKDPKITVSFTPEEWKELEVMFDKGEVPEGGKEGKGGGENNSVSTDEKSAVLQQREREIANKAEADRLSGEVEKACKKVGFKDRAGNALQQLFRQVFGLGRPNPVRAGARKQASKKKINAQHDVGAQGPPTPLEQATSDANIAEQQANDARIIHNVTLKMTSIVDKVKHKPETLTEADRKFMRECLRMRGHGQSRGVYLVAGENCGGDLIGEAIPYQQGGERYGVKIGNQNSPLYDIGKYLHDQSLKKGNPLASEDGKPAIFWSSGDKAKAAAYRAMDGVLNEYGPQLAQAWLKCKKEGKAPKDCKPMRAIVEEMISKEQFNLNLLVFGAEERNNGVLPGDNQFADIADDGVEQILNDIADELGEENVNGGTALAWYVGSLVNSWEAVVSDPMFEGCEFKVVGRGPTGQQDDGTRIAQDVQVSCPHLAEKLVVNPNNYVKSGTGIFGDDEDKNRNHYSKEEATGLNVKTGGPEGDTVAFGKSSTSVIDAVERDEEGNILGFREDTRRARNRHANWLYGIAQNNGEELTQKEFDEAEDYKLEEIRTIDNAMQAISPAGLSPATVEEILAQARKTMGFEDAEHFGELEKQIQELQNADTDKKRKKAESRIRATLTNGYRKKNQDKPGFRLNAAIEYSQTGQSTQNDGFIMTSPAGGETCMGAEGDAAGRAAADIMGYGREGGPAPIVSVTGTGIQWEGGISLNRRVKEDSEVQEANRKSDDVKKNLRCIKSAGGDSPPAENSSMKAEDFVRQLQELIKRIDKIETI